MKNRAIGKIVYFLVSFFFLALIIISKQVFIISLLMVLFEKVIFSRVNPLPFGGIEFTTLATILVVLKYGIGVGVLFVLLVFFLPGIINIFLEYKLVVNPNFAPFSIGIGPIVDLITVFVIWFLRGLDLLVLTLVVLIVKNSLSKLSGFSPMDIISIPVNFAFNLALVFYLKPYLLALLA